jgi:hypothetical protein
MSSGDRAEEFRTDLLGRLSQIYLCSRRNKDRTDFTFDIDKVNQPTEQGGLRLEKFELPFIEEMLTFQELWSIY